MKTLIRKLLLLIVPVFVLTACGGGGGGGGAPPPTGKSWETPQLIETDNVGDAIYPQIAIDTRGNAIVVWVQSDGTRFNVWANRYTAGTGWGTAELIETEAGDANPMLIESYPPQIAFDPSGNAIAVWVQSDGTRFNVWANRYTAGTGWGTAELIESDNTGNSRSPQIAFDPGGNAIAIWSQLRVMPFPFFGQRYGIWANRYAAGTGWGTANRVDYGLSSNHNSDVPQIVFDTNSNAIAVWQQFDGTNHNIWANRYTAGTGWGPAGLIETIDLGFAYSPQIAMDASGNASAVWVQWDGSSYSIWANRYTTGTGWGTADLIEVNDAGFAGSPQIDMDASGNAIAVWQQSNGTNYNIWANGYTAGAWGTAQLIETDNAGDAFVPDVAFDSSGNAIAVWLQYDGARYNIWANRYTAGAWDTAQLIETDNAGDAGSPQIAFDSSGNAIAVWTQSDGTRRNIWANHYR